MLKMLQPAVFMLFVLLLCAYAQHGITYLNEKHVKLCIFFQLSASVSLFAASMYHDYAFDTQ